MQALACHEVSPVQRALPTSTSVQISPDEAEPECCQEHPCKRSFNGLLDLGEGGDLRVLGIIDVKTTHAHHLPIIRIKEVVPPNGSDSSTVNVVEAVPAREGYHP